MEEAEQLYKEHCKEDRVPNAKDWCFLNESERDYWYRRAVFHRDFWKEALADEYAVIIGGNCYHIGEEEKTGGFRGFGGMKFKIKILKDTPRYKAGEVIMTTNLWHRGEIPKEFSVENNATTLKEPDCNTLVE
jgi:hypothetical protein